MNAATCLIDDFGPMPVVRPTSVTELGEIVRGAAAVYPLGGRTMLDLGLPPKTAGVGVDLTALTEVIDYPARDMTVTVRAGITIAALQSLLATERQRLPVDGPRADRATLGGSLAANVSGPRRHGFGTLRDYVIGISTVNDEGHETKAGGRVVKNVAGYDLCKLHVGALGTLGIISQVTLKVRPIPEANALLTLGCDSADLGPLLDCIHSSRTRPVCVDVLNRTAASTVASAAVVIPDAPWVVVVGYEDSEDTTNWQVQRLMTEIAPMRVRAVEARAGAACEPLWQALVEQTYRDEAGLSFKANMLPGTTAAFCLSAASRLPGIVLQAHAGAGIVRGHVADLSVEKAQSLVRELQTTAVAAKGNLVLTRCPPAWKGVLPVWGVPRGDWPLMRQVKEKLDPRRVFNPGRFVGGI